MPKRTLGEKPLGRSTKLYNRSSNIPELIQSVPCRNCLPRKRKRS